MPRRIAPLPPQWSARQEISGGNKSRIRCWILLLLPIQGKIGSAVRPSSHPTASLNRLKEKLKPWIPASIPHFISTSWQMVPQTSSAVRA